MKRTALMISSALFLTACTNDKEKVAQQLELSLVRDSLKIYEKLYEEAAYFSIDKNESAQQIFSPEDISSVMPKVVRDFVELNNLEGGNPLLPANTKVNKMSVINHKWLILDYYSEYQVGEVLMEYNYQPNQTTTFKVLDIVTY